MNEAQAKGLKIVEFTTRRGRYIAGDRASFPPDQADEFVAQGVARRVGSIDKMMRRRSKAD